MDEKLVKAFADHGNLMRENLIERAHLTNLMAKDKQARVDEISLCLAKDPENKPTRGILRFFNNHLYTHEPRQSMRDLYGFKYPTLPFVLFPFQQQAVIDICKQIDSGEDLLIEKSRDMGVSWLMMGITLWYWLQKAGGNDILIGSRKFEYVDKKGSLDTLIEKIRYNLYYLDSWFFPQGFDSHRHDNVANIYNPETGSFIRGEANNSNFGTSGRYKFILADEFSKWEETDDQAWTSMGDSSPCRIALSTPWGMGRRFAKLRFGGNIKILSFHWTEHPIKSAGKYKGQHPVFPEQTDAWLSPWYVNECMRRDGGNREEEISQELDIAYLSSGMPWFNNNFIQQEYTRVDKEKLEFTRYEPILIKDEYDEQNIELDRYPSGRLWIYKEPIDGWKDRYLISADPAEGKEHSDNSVCYVYDRVDGIDVAGFCGKINEEIFALILLYLAQKYNDAYIGCENNNSMGGTVNYILKTRYDNLMHEQRFDEVVDFDTIKIGWNTNKKTRGIMYKNLREAINEKKHGIVEKEVFSECLTFVNINGKPQADKGNWDDRVAAQAIKWMVHDWLPAPKLIDNSVDMYANYTRFGGGTPKRVNSKKDKRYIWG